MFLSDEVCLTYLGGHFKLVTHDFVFLMHRLFIFHLPPFKMGKKGEHRRHYMLILILCKEIQILKGILHIFPIKCGRCHMIYQCK